MTLRQPATAILTVTLLAAATANAAWADTVCEPLRQDLVGQYGVVLRYLNGVTAVSRRCEDIRAAKSLDTAALDQCGASLKNLDASYQQANATYQQELANYKALCTTTANYGQSGQPATPDYAAGDKGYSQQPSATQPIFSQNSGSQPPSQNYTSPTYGSNYSQPPSTQDVAPSYYVNQDDAGISNAIIGGIGFGFSGRGGRGPSGGKGGLVHC